MLVRLGCVGILLCAGQRGPCGCVAGIGRNRRSLASDWATRFVATWTEREVTVEPGPQRCARRQPTARPKRQCSTSRCAGAAGWGRRGGGSGRRRGDHRPRACPAALRTEDPYRARPSRCRLSCKGGTSVAMPPPAVGVVRRVAPARPYPSRAIASCLMPAWPGCSPRRTRAGSLCAWVPVCAWATAGVWGLGTYLEAAAVEPRPKESTSLPGRSPCGSRSGGPGTKGLWESWLDAVAHCGDSEDQAKATGIVSTSDTTLSPRAGGTLGFAIGVAPGLRAESGVSLLAVLADTRYRVDGQVVWPAARALVRWNWGSSYGVR